MVESLTAKEIVRYPNGGESRFYVLDQTVIIIDDGICNYRGEGAAFPYSLITDKQNDYMHRYKKVFRFLAEDAETIEEVLQNTQTDPDMDFSIRTAGGQTVLPL